MRYTLLHTTAIVLQAVVQAGGIVVESLPTVPPGWAKVSNADPVQIINLRVALSQPNENLLEQTLYDVSNPEHPLYGRHLGREEVASMMKPRDASTAAVLNWLSESGIPNLRVEDEGEWISFRITVDDAESLLDTSFAVYTYLDTGIKKIRALKYSVPEEVATHITMIAPIVRFGHIKSQWNSVFKVVNAPPRGVAARAANVPTLDLNVSECNVSITPECLRALYKIGDYQADPSGTSLLGVAGFQHVRENPMPLPFQDAFINFEDSNMPSTISWRSLMRNTPPMPRVQTLRSSALMVAGTTKTTPCTTLSRRIWTCNTQRPCHTGLA